MSTLDAAYDAINQVDFRSDNLCSTYEKLLPFAESYVLLSQKEAKVLRSSFDAKYKLDVFHSSSVLLHEWFNKNDMDKNENLLKIFFASYSFDNLEFGYDSVMDIILASSILKEYQELTRKAWKPFKLLTSNDTAISNLENKLFVTK